MAGSDLSPVAFRTVFQGSAQAAEPGLILIRTQSSLFEAMPAPDVNWDSEVVVALSLGERPTTGYKVTIEQVLIGNGELQVSAREDEPGGFGGQMITYPVHVIAVPATDIPDNLRLTTPER